MSHISRLRDTNDGTGIVIEESTTVRTLSIYCFTLLIINVQLLFIVHGIPLKFEKLSSEYSNEVAGVLSAENPSGCRHTSSATDAHLNYSWFEQWEIRSDAATASWSYADTGSWSLSYPACGGSRQSPINIVTATKTSYPKFQFENYGNIDHMTVTNNGHTVLFSLPRDLHADKIPCIAGGGLPDKYNFFQFHVHWGTDSSRGSEHLIKSKTYAAELHLVHYNIKYESASEATKYKDGLAVLAVLLQVANRNNKALQPIVDQLNEVVNEGDETTLQSLVSLRDLLPSHASSFFRYAGSLTTPSCDEIVVWTVFDRAIDVSENQLEKFRKIKSFDGSPLVNNFRQIQPVNDRTITYRPSTGCIMSKNWPDLSFLILDIFQYASCLRSYYTNSFLGW